MKLLYLSTWDFTNEGSDGVCKKIYSQIAVFEKSGFTVDFIYIKDGKILYRENGKTEIIGSVGAIRKTPAYIKMYKTLKDRKYHWVYNRYGMMDTFYYRMLKKLKKNGARILIEIPTYPYAGERPRGLLYRFMFWWDKIYAKKMKKIVERIVTYSQDEVIYSIPTIKIMNGVNAALIDPIKRKENADDVIDLLMVALMQPRHGYERLLYGIARYYRDGGTRKIMCHFVGDGPERKTYEKIAEDCDLQGCTKFYGMKGGKELDNIYNKADIGVCIFGAYKQNQYWCSDLKSKEYLAKGLPVITGVETDILKLIDKKYYLQFPNNETIVDVKEIVQFYDRIYQSGNNDVVDSIRNMVEKYIAIEETMKPISGYLLYS